MSSGVATAAAGRELKWWLPAGRSRACERFLAGRLRPDRDHPRGWVVSVYYDTPTWRLLREKVNSDYLKTKVRLRYYEDDDGHPLGTQAFLEAKQKVGSQRGKIRIPLSREDLPERLDGRAMRALPELLRRRGVALPAPLLPAFAVRYFRSRWVDPRSGSRVCLDRDIRVPAVNRAMLPRTRAGTLDATVLEVKGGGTSLPASLRPLAAFGCRRRSFSKYAACHAFLFHGAQ